ncbi:MAG: hypothetical protein HPY45_13675 [Anaerolineae bacterium]|nr:hypothetical protein [Anaerolineae bacterium]
MDMGSDAHDNRTGGHSLPKDVNAGWDAQQEHWTGDITRLMMLVSAIAAGIILAFTLDGWFTFLETLPIYIVLALLLPAWQGAKRGGWRWQGIFQR